MRLAHSAPYRPHGIPREPQPASTRKPGQKRCTGSRAILDPRSKNWRHSTPRAPFWTQFWRATKAHSAPYACCECWASFASEHVQGSGPRTRTHCPSSAVRSSCHACILIHASERDPFSPSGRRICFRAVSASHLLREVQAAAWAKWSM